MFPDKRPALYAAVRWLTAAWIVLSTHGFWFENVLIVTVSVACSFSVLTKLNATSANSLTSDELSWNMSQSTSSRAAYSIASEWEDQHVTTLFTRDSWTSLCLCFGVRKVAEWSNLPKAGSERALKAFLNRVAMIQCIRSSSWTGYMLIKVRHDVPEVGFVKVPRDDKGSAVSGCLSM